MNRRTVALAGHTGDVPTARAGLESTDAGVRATALGALERLGALTDAEVSVALQDLDPGVRRRAVTFAARRNGLDLAALLDDRDPAVAEATAWACGERDAVSDAVMERLIGLAGEAGADPLVRESCVAALGALAANGDGRGLDAVLAATTDKPAIRRRAVLALAAFLDPDHHRAEEVDAALQRALTDRDWQVRQAAEDLLAATE